jgi:hypothetical protein
MSTPSAPQDVDEAVQRLMPDFMREMSGVYFQAARE